MPRTAREAKWRVSGSAENVILEVLFRANFKTSHRITMMTIGQLAGAAGVATSTVRFYERAGLLRADHRSAGNYREYDEQSLERLRFIRSAQAVGLSLKDVVELLKLTRGDED